MSAVLAVVLLAGLVAGCGGGGDVLARIGDETITVDDFERAARGVASRYGNHPDSSKALLLEDLIGLLERLAPQDAGYAHDALHRRANVPPDERPNGHSHAYGWRLGGLPR